MKTRSWPCLVPVLLTVAALAHAQPVDVRQGLVAYWPLDTTDGVTTPDATPFANHLNLVNMDAGNFVPGRHGNAASFDGINEILSLIYTAGTDNGLPAYAARRYTVMLWVNGVGAAQGDRRVFSEGSTASNNQLFNIGTDSAAAATRTNVVDIYIRSDGNTALVSHRKSTGMAFDGTWHHIAWVEEDGAARLYIDGQLDATVFDYTPGVLTLNTISVGGIQRAATGSYFNGLIDDVAVWERPLSQAEIQQVMTNSMAAPVPEFLPLFIVQPAGRTVAVGDRVTFASRAVGNRPLNYQWYKNGFEVAGAMANALTLSGLTPAESGDYTVVAANFSGSVTSTVATLTVMADPTPDVRQGLVSYWPLDVIDPLQPAGFSTPDLYSRNDMRLVTAGFFDTAAGAFSNAVIFTGTDQYGVRTGGFPTYNNQALSVALWVNAVGIGQSDRRFFAESSTNNSNPLFTFGTHTSGADGTIRVYIRNDVGAVLLDRASTRAALDGTWHHMVWTETNGQGKLYIDGVLDESNFNYARGTLTLDQTTLGAILRTTVGAFFTGALDDVAVWNRVLTFTEIQEIRTNGIPAPVSVIPPTITEQPVSQSVLTRSKVRFSFTASGTSPLTARWRKDGDDLAGATNFVLVLTNVALGDAGGYDVIVANSAGRATSDVATLTVALRPPPPAGLKIDFDNTNAPPTDTEAGFLPFQLPALGLGPFTRSYGGADVTLLGVGANLASRRRATPTNNAVFTQEQLLRDFIFAADSALDQGMDIVVEFLEPNQSFAVTVWSFDTTSTGNRISDWSANGVPVRSGYAFDGGVLPIDNSTYQFAFDTTSDADGRILIQGRRNAGATVANNVFINALEVARRELRVTRIDIEPFGDLHLTISVLNPAASHRIEEKASLTDPAWTEVTGVLFTGPNGNILEATFPAPTRGTRFYRVAEGP